ncbi:hypothetical protein GCM10009841_04690 [Microlunatus panaciterrae]|uniref:Flp pilus-assembly TadE/G-like n=1 Tax=Microlunatus panaciterrae TaxID=400768 RepID=A0ABS2RJN5_9ACTN|nr:pilus assembly protein TadG-related protein [Microlunatus panaciterrae]MBM7798873.1 hypothetical protein [Microlunatus panaciterrae]
MRRSQRGQSVSVFVVLVTMALILTAGLVVDGGQKVTAVSRAETAAAGAARAAGNAAAAGSVVGTPDVSAATAAARTFLAGTPGVTGSVTLTAGTVVVDTRAAASTVFLSLIGIDRVSGTGHAVADVVAVGGGG